MLMCVCVCTCMIVSTLSLSPSLSLPPSLSLSLSLCVCVCVLVTRFPRPLSLASSCCVLQEFRVLPNEEQNDVIQAVWSPNVVLVNRRQNIYQLKDPKIPLFNKAATFDGKPHLSRPVYCTPKLHKMVESCCEEVVAHFHGADTRSVLSRMVLHLKVDQKSKYLLPCLTRSKFAAILHLLPVACRRSCAGCAGCCRCHNSTGMRADHGVTLDCYDKFGRVQRRRSQRQNGIVIWEVHV